jgi:hypothetical protein
MKTLPKKIKLLDSAQAKVFSRKLESVVESVYSDYFLNKISMQEFWEKCVFHESVVMKIAAYRFCSSHVMDVLFSLLIDRVNGLELLDHNESFIRHPIFYTRISNPRNNGNVTSGAFYDSQPHFDRAFNVYAYSCWLALEKANLESGGLCFFKNNELLNNEFNVSWSEKNKYNYDLYLNNYLRLDSILVSNTIHPDLSAGEAYLFDSDILHAATKPFGSKRVSLDFRICEKTKINNCDNRSKKIFDIFNFNIDYSNALNLITLGDIKGALSICPNISEISCCSIDLIVSKLKKYDPDVLIQKFAWRDEYSFVDHLSHKDFKF